MRTPLTSGSLLKHYRLGPLLGRGGMGEVYAAEDSRLARKVAIKVLPAAFNDHPERLRRFSQEARAASALNHPSIVTIHDIDEADGTTFIVFTETEPVLLRR